MSDADKIMDGLNDALAHAGGEVERVEHWVMGGTGADLEMREETRAAIPTAFRPHAEYLRNIPLSNGVATIRLRVNGDFSLADINGLADLFWTKSLEFEVCEVAYDGDHDHAAVWVKPEATRLREWFYSPPESQRRQEERNNGRREQLRQQRIAEARRVLTEEGEE